MPSIITGIYFDGKSTKPQAVNIELNPNFLRFGNRYATPALGEKIILIDALENIDFSSAHKVQLQFGEFPAQTIVISEPTSVDTFNDYYPQFQKDSIYSRILKGRPFKIVTLAVLIMIGVVFLYLNFAAPIIATSAVNLFPKTAEIALGEKMTESLFKTLAIDESKSEQLNSFFEKAGFKSDYPVELFVCEKKVINAFAVPGGKIVVYQGILDEMDSWEELAAVLGHELAHVEQRHSLKLMSKKLSTYLVFSIMTSDISGVAAVFLENAFMLENLSNSRNMETEADEIGFQYLKDLSINPQGMVDLFKTLQSSKSENDNIKKLSEAMSTHPLTEDRILHAQEQIDALPQRNYRERTELDSLFVSLQSMPLEEDNDEENEE